MGTEAVINSKANFYVLNEGRVVLAVALFIGAIGVMVGAIIARQQRARYGCIAATASAAGLGAIIARHRYETRKVTRPETLKLTVDPTTVSALQALGTDATPHLRLLQEHEPLLSGIFQRLLQRDSTSDIEDWIRNTYGIQVQIGGIIDPVHRCFSQISQMQSMVAPLGEMLAQHRWIFQTRRLNDVHLFRFILTPQQIVEYTEAYEGLKAMGALPHHLHRWRRWLDQHQAILQGAMRNYSHPENITNGDASLYAAGLACETHNMILAIWRLIQVKPHLIPELNASISGCNEGQLQGLRAFLEKHQLDIVVWNPDDKPTQVIGAFAQRFTEKHADQNAKLSTYYSDKDDSYSPAGLKLKAQLDQQLAEYLKANCVGLQLKDGPVTARHVAAYLKAV